VFITIRVEFDGAGSLVMVLMRDFATGFDQIRQQLSERVLRRNRAE
jgi:hypothetical protein